MTSTKTWEPLPNWPFPIPWREIAAWESRDVPKDKLEEIKTDALNYINWALDFMRHENNRTIDEGYKLYGKMASWKPEMFPLKASIVEGET